MTGASVIVSAVVKLEKYTLSPDNKLCEFNVVIVVMAAYAAAQKSLSRSKVMISNGEAKVMLKELSVTIGLSKRK